MKHLVLAAAATLAFAAPAAAQNNGFGITSNNPNAQAGFGVINGPNAAPIAAQNGMAPNSQVTTMVGVAPQPHPYQAVNPMHWRRPNGIGGGAPAGQSANNGGFRGAQYQGLGGRPQQAGQSPRPAQDNGGGGAPQLMFGFRR